MGNTSHRIIIEIIDLTGSLERRAHHVTWAVSSSTKRPFRNRLSWYCLAHARGLEICGGQTQDDLRNIYNEQKNPDLD